MAPSPAWPVYIEERNTRQAPGHRAGAGDGLASAGETASQALMRQGQRRYAACWVERRDPGGRGAASSWDPLPFEEARAVLIAELERNLGRWAGTGGSDPARYSNALEALKAATGPVSIDPPGHVLTITEAPDTGNDPVPGTRRPARPPASGRDIPGHVQAGWDAGYRIKAPHPDAPGQGPPACQAALFTP
jgi:hypothetical protein